MRWVRLFAVCAVFAGGVYGFSHLIAFLDSYVPDTPGFTEAQIAVTKAKAQVADLQFVVEADECFGVKEYECGSGAMARCQQIVWVPRTVCERLGQK